MVNTQDRSTSTLVKDLTRQTLLRMASDREPKPTMDTDSGDGALLPPVVNTAATQSHRQSWSPSHTSPHPADVHTTVTVDDIGLSVVHQPTINTSANNAIENDECSSESGSSAGSGCGVDTKLMGRQRSDTGAHRKEEARDEGEKHLLSPGKGISLSSSAPNLIVDKIILTPKSAHTPQPTGSEYPLYVCVYNSSGVGRVVRSSQSLLCVKQLSCGLSKLILLTGHL